ncbi:MAG: hypothetical protein FJX75_13070 [Armatimonadetes bacterium]|nr:hypothetical protein [Armatimonadota bacterium]
MTMRLPLPADLVHIPGPNPILTPGAPGDWDDGVIESCDVIKDHDTYYLYYHGTSAKTGYQVGAATAPHPLGPWTKHGSCPVLPVGPPGSWDDRHVACACIVKEGVGSYSMVYSGHADRDGGTWDVGLATADSPLGPWRKHDANPVLPHFGYVGGVVRMPDHWRLYTEHPIGSTGDDCGPIALATAPTLAGPWTPYEGNPVLAPGGWGDWDDGGFSEAKVLRRGDLFHIFYGGAKLHPRRILSQESIGYAWSEDGLQFAKHPLNPVAPREANPDAAAFAEVHAYFERPFVYLYHTLRYNSRPGAEDSGVQVLATSRPFRLSMPVLQVSVLPARGITELEDCRPISLARVTACALSVECAYEAAAQAGLRVHVRGSVDGLRYDTENLRTFDLPCTPGQTVRATLDFEPRVMFAKVVVENLDGSQPARGLRVDATLGG